MMSQSVFLRLWVAALVFGCATIAPAVAEAQVQESQMTLQEAMSGTKIPLTLKAADLTNDYRAFELVGGFDSIFRDTGGFAGGGGPSKLFGTYWTRFDKVVADGRHYLVCYRAAMPIYQGSMQRPELAPEMRLAFINLDSAAGLQPCPPDVNVDFLKTMVSGKGEPLEPMSVRTSSMSNFKQLAVCVAMYCADYDDKFPQAQSTKEFMDKTAPYRKNDDITKTLNPNGGRILFNMALSGVNQNDLVSPESEVLLFDSLPWPDGGRLVAFADCHVKYVTAEQWATMANKLKPVLGQPKKPKPGK